MSHAATKWAIEQRGIRPAAKIVLWQLCDRYHPDNGCFPSQETLSADCELSRSALNAHLKALEDARLLAREPRRDPATNKVISTRYRFPFEDDFPAEPCRDSGHGPVSGNQAEPCPENDDSRVRNPDTNLVIEPVTEPIERDARARLGEAEDEPHTPNAIWLDALRAKAPTTPYDDREAVETAWRKLGVSDRKAALDRYDEWLAGARKLGRNKIAGLVSYLGDRRFEALAPPPSSATGLTPKAGAFDRAWWWLYWDFLERFAPQLDNRDGWAAKHLRDRCDLSSRNIGWPLGSYAGSPDDLADLEERASRLRLVGRDSDTTAMLRDHCLAVSRWIHMPLPDQAEFIFAPAELIEQLERAHEPEPDSLQDAEAEA